MSHFPSEKQFLSKSKSANTIPVWTEIFSDLETPVSAYLKLCGDEEGYLLESVEGGEQQARYSFVGLKPDSKLIHDGKQVTLRHASGKSENLGNRDPIEALKKVMNRYVYSDDKNLPRFTGGAVGYLSYECSRIFEPKVPKSKGKQIYPLMEYLIVSKMLVFDHLKQKLKIVNNVTLKKGLSLQQKKTAYHKALIEIDSIQKRLTTTSIETANIKKLKTKKTPIVSSVTKKDFTDAVKKIKKKIHGGEAIQVVFSRKFRKKTDVKPISLYRALRSINPSPYTFYINCGDHQLIGSSPELHVRCVNGLVELRPIAGTRPRGKNSKVDDLYKKELLADHKECAEHVMLVDLGRNDLGRVCDSGSVEVRDFMIVESYSHVMHIVSHVQGQLSKSKDVFDVIRSTFPAGTVSGAPKVRAMQIIAGLEKEARGPYAGLVGYLSFSGNFDSCITIRTMLYNKGQIEIQAGAGIVSDSKPESEYQESDNKAKGLFLAIDVAERELQ